MTKHRSVEMFEVRIPVDAVKRLTQEQRYTYYVLGHMFNELMCLQKLCGFALPKHEDMRPARRRPELAQAMLLFRLASSKAWEAKLALDSKEVSQTLTKMVLPHVEGGADRRKALNDRISSAKWLGPLRNGLGFHAPKFSEWDEHITPTSEWVDDVLYVGRQSGNVFYEAAEAIAQAWTLKTCAVGEQPDSLVEQMIALLVEFTNYLAEVIGVFVAHVILVDIGKMKPIGKTLAPEFGSVAIPFWTSMPLQDDVP